MNIESDYIYVSAHARDRFSERFGFEIDSYIVRDLLFAMARNSELFIQKANGNQWRKATLHRTGQTVFLGVKPDRDGERRIVLATVMSEAELYHWMESGERLE